MNQHRQLVISPQHIYAISRDWGWPPSPLWLCHCYGSLLINMTVVC